MVALQRGVFAADVVELRDERRDGDGVRAVPGAELILFAVEVLFAAGLAGGGFGGAPFAEFVGGAVDAVVGGERGGEDDALHEDGAALGGVSTWSWAWRMSGVLGQTLGRKKSETGGLQISSKYSVSSAWRCAR